MDDTRLIRTLVAAAEAPVDPPSDFHESLWETLQSELTADARASIGFGEAPPVDDSRPGLVPQSRHPRSRRPGGVWVAVAMFSLIVAVGLAVWAIRPQEPAGEITDSPPSTVPADDDTDADADTGGEASVSGVWSQAETTLGRDEFSPRLFVIDDRVLVIHEQNQGTTVVGEIYDPAVNEARPIADSGLAWRAHAAMVWTGTELLIVGGSNGPGIDQIGAAYDPASDMWRLLPDPPGEVDGWDGSITGAAVWTGTEMLIPARGLAFDPVTDQWRTVTPQPGPERNAPVTAWTGTEVLVWGGCDAAIPQCDDFERGLLTDGYAYTPATDAWRPLAPGPLATGVHPAGEWTGTGLLVFAGTGHPDDGVTFARYDPYRDRWQELAEPPLAPRRYAASTWTGRSFVLWGGSADPEREFSDGAVYDIDSNTWESLPPAPNSAARDRHAMTWVAGRLYITGGHRTLGPLVFTPDGGQADVLETSTTEPIPLDQAIPFRVLAVGASGAGIAVIDLSERITTIYGAGALPVHRTDGAVAAPNGAWITWNEGTAFFFADGLGRVTAELGPDRVRSLPGIAPSLRAVPDPAGDRVWLVQPGRGFADHDEPTLVQLVPVDGGPPILDIAIDPNAFPRAATATGLVLNTHAWSDTGYVTAPGTESVLHLRDDGTIDTVGPGVAIAAGSTRIARLVCPPDRAGCDPFAHTNRLVITDPDGSNPVEVDGPFEGVWRSVGGPAIPSDSMPLQAASPAGVEMLVSISRTVDVNAMPIDPTLVAVSLDDGIVRTIADVGPALATWSADSRWIVVTSGRDLVLIAAGDPDHIIELKEVIPEGFWPLAAG